MKVWICPNCQQRNPNNTNWCVRLGCMGLKPAKPTPLARTILDAGPL